MTKKNGFTLIELLVVIAIIAILAAILFPVFTRAKESGKRAFCTGNMKQIYAAMTMYADDNNGFMPWEPAPASGSDWSKQRMGYACLFSYVKKAQVFMCPNSREYGTTSVEVTKRAADPEPICYMYTQSGQMFKASYHFWPQIYKQYDTPNIPARFDVNVNDRNINLWKWYPSSAKACVDMKGPLVDNFLHPLSDTKDGASNFSNGVLVLTTKGSVKFMPVHAYPFKN